jgi:hypothetical protein
VFQPAVSVQMYCPPVIQCVGLLTSFSIGVMNRGFGSQFLIGARVSASLQETEISRYVCPASVVSA